MITVDYREAALIGELGDDCKRENLIHGDIIISSLPEKTCEDLEYVDISKDIETENLFYVVERKTLSDLSASIKDARFREQKSRLISVYPNDKIVYIIEGWKINKYSLPEKTLVSAIINLIFKHGFKVLFTRSLQDTATVIKDIHAKLLKGELNGDKIDYGQENLGFIPIKKSDISENNAFACQLATIPGVSASIATIIQKKYTNMSNFIRVLESETEPGKFLSGIQITPKRKIGPKLSEKIYKALF